MIKVYHTELHGEDRLPVLVKEREFLFDMKGDCAENVVHIMNEYFMMNSIAEERVYTVALDACMNIKGIFETAHGGMTSAQVEPRNIFEKLFLSGASSFILVHNHPSGDCTESDCDVQLHERLSELSKMMGVSYLDFIIMGDRDHRSFAGAGKMKKSA